MQPYITIEEIIERVETTLPTFMTQKYITPAEYALHIYDGLRKIGMLKTNEKEVILLRLEEKTAVVPVFVETIINIMYDSIILNKVEILDETKDKYAYTIESGNIVSDIKEGDIWVYVSYVPLDSNGNPMIPNKQYAISAITAYLTERLMYKLYLMDLINENKYQRAEDKWLYYSAQARVASLLPSVDEEYKLSKSMLKVLPKFTRGINTAGNQPTASIKMMNVTDLNRLVTAQYAT